MTAITVPQSLRRDDAQPERRLRAVLTLNAATSFVTGIAGLAASSWWSDRLGLDSPGWTRLVSAGLVLFALGVALVARSRPEHLRPLAAVVSAADIAWVLATVGLIAAGALSSTGVVVALVIGVAVADFALLQLWFRQRMAER